MQRIQNLEGRSRSNLLGCVVAFSGCALITSAIACVSVVLFSDAFVGVGMQIAGFEAEGRTDDVLARETAPDATPFPQLANPVEPQTFSVSAGSYGQETIPNNSGASLAVGADDTGQQLATVTASESDVQALCRQWSPACTSQGVMESGVAIRNVSIDLKNGGAIVYGEIQPENVNNYWQRMGVVLQLDSSGKVLTVRGVDINDVLYTNPPDNLADLINRAETVANEAVRQLAVSAQGEQYTLESINITENTMTVLLR